MRTNVRFRERSGLFTAAFLFGKSNSVTSTPMMSFRAGSASTRIMSQCPIDMSHWLALPDRQNRLFIRVGSV
jgi:hypothetical protein